MRFETAWVLCAMCLLGCAAGSGPSPAPARAARSLPATPAPVAPQRAASEAPAAPAQAAIGSAPEIDALIERAIAERRLPGCVVAIGHGDRIAFLRAYGKRALVPQEEPMTVDTVFDLASLTKPLATAAAIMRLIDDGALAPDDRVSRYLPQLGRNATRAITVRQLLLHAAGLPHVNPLREYDRGPEAALAAALALDPTRGTAGTFTYSDVGFLWLGELVHRVAGEPLDRYAQRTLFEPLAMRDTRFMPGPELVARIAPTELTDLRGPQPVLIRGSVHDPRAYRLGGVAGHAGLFSTAADVARFARMLLGNGALDGTRVLSESAIAEMTHAARVGAAQRALGWDVRSVYSRLRGTMLSERAFGHGGHTGTSLWIDPGRDLFVLLLSNRVHPDGKGNVIGLAGEIADAAVRAFGARDARCDEPAPRVLPGIDVLREGGYAPLQGKRVGLLTHMAARGSDGVPTLDLLAGAPGVTLAAIFSPEHGLSGRREGVIASSAQSPQGAPVHSLFGPNRRPTPAMLQGLDVLVVDLVDVGTRFYTYMSTLREVLRAAGEHRIPVIVLDRPNPLGGLLVEGPVLDPDVRTFVNHYALPIRHGLTAGELAALMNAEQRFGASLQVIEARGLRREITFERSGLRWSAPSPNLHSDGAALLYPGVGLLEASNVSVGRGTKQPFALVGAPFVQSAGLLARLRAARLPGVRFSTADFTPARERYAGELCHGVQLTVTDRAQFRPVRTGLEIAAALHALYGERFDLDKVMKLLGSKAAMEGLRGGTRIAALERAWEPELFRYRERAAPFHRYPRCD